MGEIVTIAEAILAVLRNSSVPMRTAAIAEAVEKTLGARPDAVRTKLRGLLQRGDLFQPQRGFYRIATAMESVQAAMVREEKKRLSVHEPRAGYTTLDKIQKEALLHQFESIIRSMQAVGMKASRVDDGAHDSMGTLIYALVDSISALYPPTDQNRAVTKEIKDELLGLATKVAPAND